MFIFGIDNNIDAVIRKPVKDMVPAATYDDSAVFFELLTKDATQKIVELIEKARTAKAPFTIRYINKVTGKSLLFGWILVRKTGISRKVL